ncbi:HlyC/CorC family transporter [Candidatus Tisiphia endosymbiont of Nemotelus uliginosus]|uniref:HlyC/CorC family transporter n=1 Tax=Candidatus Tisiphia endosymbiont of Nemotelus uliginosus TaxID=3077926 RepID=UPI0035C904F8
MAIFLIIIVTIMIGWSAILSATETAITASSPGKIQKLKLKNTKHSIGTLEVLKNKEKVIGTLLIVNTLSNTICTTISTSMFIGWLGDSGTVVATAVMAFVIIVFGEVIPKAIAVAKAEQLALLASPFILYTLKIFKPINSAFTTIIKIFCFIFRINLQQKISGAEEVRGVIEHYHQEGNVYKADRDMLGGILDIRQMTVSEIMIHRSNIVAINIDLPKDEIVKRALSCPHTRIPVWQDSQDNIIGLLHTRDLFRVLYEHNNDTSKINITNLINMPWFIPDNALVTHQLNAFRERKNHFACVVDEYGDLQGIITLEDILEEIVGPIIDEHDYPINTIVKLSETEFIIDGSATIRDVNRELNWNISDDNATTIAGLIIHTLKRIPNQGESLKILNLDIVVSKKVGNRINSVKVNVMPIIEAANDQ